MVTRDEIIYAFRLLLGREPESHEVIEQFLPVTNWANLRKIFLASEEFKLRVLPESYVSGVIDYVNSAPNSVDVDISDSQLERLLNHVQSAWEILGRQQPHWSVLTNPVFLPEHVEANIKTFYDSGENGIKILEWAADRAGISLSANLRCFELGCGVGRVTAYLARKFAHVMAADISEPHLQLAAKYLEEQSTKNVTLYRLQFLRDLRDLEPFDVFYSIIVLQHNPPPLIYRMLQLIMEKVKPGGYVFFQVPVAAPHYRFSIDEYLASMAERGAQMEMHVLPQKYLFRLLEERQFRILDLQKDNWTGPGFYSVTVLAEKQL